MKVEINVEEDENFRLVNPEAKVEEVVGETPEEAPEVEDVQPVRKAKKPVPMNSKGCDLFDGTMWGN